MYIYIYTLYIIICIYIYMYSCLYTLSEWVRVLSEEVLERRDAELRALLLPHHLGATQLDPNPRKTYMYTCMYIYI